MALGRTKTTNTYELKVQTGPSFPLSVHWGRRQQLRQAGNDRGSWSRGRRRPFVEQDREWRPRWAAIPEPTTTSLWTSGGLYPEGKSVLLETGRFPSES